MFRKRVHLIVFHFVVESRDVEWFSGIWELARQHCVHVNTSEIKHTKSCFTTARLELINDTCPTQVHNESKASFHRRHNLSGQPIRLRPRTWVPIVVNIRETHCDL